MDLARSHMTAHTRGPWLVGPFGEIWPASDVAFVGGKWREKCPEPRIIASPVKSHPEVEANARLIAAAPELLEAARQLSAVYDGIYVKMSDSEMALCRDAWAKMDAAIAKAEGRS